MPAVVGVVVVGTDYSTVSRDLGAGVAPATPERLAAIAPVVGVSNYTVHKDLQPAVSPLTPGPAERIDTDATASPRVVGSGHVDAGYRPGCRGEPSHSPSRRGFYCFI